MAAAGRRVGTLVHHVRGCMLESWIARGAGSSEGNAASWSSQACSNIFSDYRTLAPCAAVSTSSESYRGLFPSDHLKKNSSFGGAFVRSASGFSEKTTNFASAKAAGIREEVEEVKKIDEESSDENKVHEGVHRMKQDSSGGNPKDEQREEQEVVDEKTKTLRAALAHVPKLGWTEAAMVAGAKDVGLSPAIVGAFQRKEAALVEFFMDECALALAEELEDREGELANMVLNDRVAAIVWIRLEMQIPYLSKWAQAMSIQAIPLNVPTTIKQRALLVDDIWHAAGDRSADMDWYAKRALLAGVYSTTELYMLTDTSPGFRDTKTYLERRIADAIECRKSVKEASQLAQALGAGFQNTLNSLLNRARSPSGFKF